MQREEAEGVCECEKKMENGKNRIKTERHAAKREKRSKTEQKRG